MLASTLITILTAASAAMAAPAPQRTIPSGGDPGEGRVVGTRIRLNSHRNMCLYVQGSFQNNREARLGIRTCTGQEDERFEVKPEGHIQLLGTDKCVDVMDAKVGSPLTVSTCPPTDQIMSWVSDGVDTRFRFRFFNPNIKLCMDNSYGKVEEGNQVFVWPCMDGNKNQEWVTAA